MDILQFAVFLILLHAVTSKKCYYGQEPDHGGKLRWVMPGSQKERCSCTAILPGGVNTMVPVRPHEPHYTNQPLFTDDVKLIYDYFDCHDESTPPTTIKTREYADCQAWFDAGSTSSGVYTISLPSHTGGEAVYCDMEDGKEWLVFQRRQDGSISFAKNWLEYKEGFGDLNGEFWLGNEALRLLTTVEDGSNWTIRVDLTDENGQQMSVTTSPFNITGDKYTISIGSPEIQPIVNGLCGQQLGMEDGTIPDTSIKASSVYEDLLTGLPSLCIVGKGRLNYVGGGGGWCPQKDNMDTSWFQVDLSKPTQVEGIIMQGSFYEYPVLYAEWVTKYKVEYSYDQSTWNYVGGTSLDTAQVFDGNTDTDTPVTSLFDEPIQARYIRIRPIEYHEHPSMRIELIGCKGGIIESLNGRQFSTQDNDNDIGIKNCADLSQSGWWFDGCEVESNLNGEYLHRVGDSGWEYRGIQWFAWPGRQIVKSEMKMRRNN